MHIEITGRNLQVEETLRQQVEHKLEKLHKFLSEPIEARLTLDVEKHRHIAELHVTHRAGVLQAKEESEALMLDVVHVVLDKMIEQARRFHSKRVTQRRRGDSREGRDGHRWPVDVLENASVGGGEVPRIIESTHLEIKPMTVEEAALTLEDSKDKFVVFRDAANEKVSVLYKRKDDNYGLIAPEP